MVIKKRSALVTLGLTTLFFSSISLASVAKKEVDQASVSNSLQLVETILVKSSVAKRVQESNSKEAISLLNNARTHYERSQFFLRKDQTDKAVIERDLALQLAMKAARLASKKLGDSDDNKLEDYEKRLSSVEVLLAAHNRISVEKSNLNLDKNLNRVLTPFIDESKQYAKKGEYQQAILSLNKAYAMVTSSIENQRAGETLVRSLDFETKQDEYNYEFGRYENYLTLVKMLIDERQALVLDATSKPVWDKAHQQSNQAQALAGKGEYDQAIKRLDQASKNLINLIRYAGVYIPGG